MSASSLTPLDYIAEDYWQDFLDKRPIAGSMAYEAQLRNCQLDESLVSLQRIDTLLSQIRRDRVKASTWDETTILADERYRNLLVFLAFYAGRILARQWQNTPHWYGQFELRARYPKLAMTTDDFYQHMAVLYNDTSVFIAAVTHDTNIKGSEDNNRDDSNYKVIAPVFFALEPIGLRLFGHIDRHFEAVHGGQIASGLYQAVITRLPNVTAAPVTAGQTATVVPILSTSLNLGSDVSLNSTQAVMLAKTTEGDVLPEVDSKTAPKVTSAITDKTLNNPAGDKFKPVDSRADRVSANKISANKASIIPTLVAVTDAGSSGDENHAKSIPTEDLSSLPKKVAPLVAPPTPEIFIQLLTELDEIEVTQTVGNDDYQQARKILDQFEQYIAKQNKPRAQVIFSESHQAAKQQALMKLKNSADLSNTAAMLRLAMYELLDERLTTDSEKGKDTGKDTGKEVGVEWIKQAAHKKDSRAQRLLSRMYYQGVGVPQDINSGKHWLEQAAENGHVEAANLVGQWQQAQTLITTRQQEQHSLKRYQLLIGAVIVAALLLIIFV
ncbi:tetratricopeptide repeat protein [Psychrobacter sp. 72-O-c]|uniref:tetratricopeptide repeat protein n=1 Tax=Psychrobacter sp. 72-O-c TaxID=2774125 RepID=UPI0019190592